MKKIYSLVGYLLSNVEKEKLVEKIPDFEDTISEVIHAIKESPSIDTANHLFDILYVLTWPLATLMYKHQVKLPENLVEFLRYERIDDPEFRKQVYDQIKIGKILE